MNDTIGIFYELPNGKIAKTIGWNKVQKIIIYYFEGLPFTTVSEDEFQTWKPRTDLKDFPNAKDPRLPYIFDLYWDIKYTSELEYILAEEDHEDLEDIKDEILAQGLETQFGLRT